MHKPTAASRWIVLLVTLALLVPLVSCAPSTSADPTTVSDPEGGVWVQKEGSGEWVEAASGMKLEEGDTVRTGEGGHVLLVFFEGSVMEVEADSEIVVEEISVDPDTGSTMVRLRQTIGSTVNRVEKLIDPASRYEVETSAGIMLVRGTTSKVLVRDDGYTEVFCVEGEVWFTAAGVTVLVEEGERSGAMPGEEPSEPRDNIVIGAARSLSGPLMVYEEFAFGPVMELWVEEVNADGGIYVDWYGRKLPVELDRRDDYSDLGNMTSLLNGFISDRAHDFVLPPIGAEFLQAAAEICNDNGWVLLGAEGGCTAITDDLVDLPYLFATLNYSNHNQMEELFRLLDGWWETHHDPDTMDIYVIYNDDYHGIEYRDEFAAEAAIYNAPTVKFNIVAEVAVPPDTSYVSAQVIEAKDTYDVDVLCSFAYPPTTEATITGAVLNNKNFNAIVLGPGGNYEFIYDTYLGNLVDGVIGFGAWNEYTITTGADPTAQDFAAAMIDKRGRTYMDWWGAIYFYAGLQCFQQAIGQAGTLDQSIIRDVLASEHFTTVLGDTWFADAAGNHPIPAGGGLLAKECHAGQIGQWQDRDGTWIFEVIDIGPNNTATGVYPKPDWPTPPLILLSPISGPPGTEGQVTGTGFTAQVSVDVTIDSLTVAAAVTTTAGNFSTNFLIPLSLEPGAYTVEAVDGSDISASATFTVLP